MSIPRKPRKFFNYEVCWHGENDAYEHVDTKTTKKEAIRKGQEIVYERGGFVHVLKTFYDYNWDQYYEQWESECLDQICVHVIRSLPYGVVGLPCNSKEN